jgi:hypothetical protein
MVIGAFIGGIWSAWRPGDQLRVPTGDVVAEVLAYLIAGTLVMAAYGAGIGAILMGVWAAIRHLWRPTV